MSKELFGELTLSQAVSRMKVVCERGTVFVFTPSHGTVKECNQDFREAAETILNFVELAVDVFQKNNRNVIERQEKENAGNKNA